MRFLQPFSSGTGQVTGNLAGSGLLSKESFVEYNARNLEPQRGPAYVHYTWVPRKSGTLPSGHDLVMAKLTLCTRSSCI